MGNREHRYVDRQLSAYVDGELGHRARARVETHLARCQECRASIRSLRWTKQLLRQAPAVRVPRSFVVREADLSRSPSVRVRRPLLATQWATAVVALLFVLVLGGDLLLGARLPGAFDVRSLRGESEIAAPAALESEQVAMVEQAAPVTIEAAEKVVAEEAVPAEGAAEAPVEEPVERAVPEAETVGDLADPPPGVRGEFAAPLTTTVPGEPMMMLAVPKETYTETQQLEAAPEAAPKAPGTPAPEPERRAEVAEAEPPTGGGEIDRPTVEGRAAPDDGDERRAAGAWTGVLGRTFWIGVEALLGVALLGLAVAVVWMRMRR